MTKQNNEGDLRVDAAQLFESDGLLIHVGTPYSGLIFKREANGVLSHRVAKGRIVEPYALALEFDVAERLVPDFADRPRVDAEIVEGLGPDERRVTVEGASFTGIAYEFEGHHCVREILFAEGYFVYDASWYSGGQRESFALFDGNLGGAFDWDANGTLTRTHIALGDRYMSLSYDEAGRLKDLTIEGDFFAGSFPRVLDDVPVGFPHAPEDFALTFAAGPLTVWGAATAPVLSALAQNDGLRELQDFYACEVPWTAEHIALLDAAPALERVEISDRISDDSAQAALQALARRRPDVKVIYLDQLLAP